MQLTIEHADLLKTLSHVQSVVERRPDNLILGNILIKVEEGHLNMTSTDNTLTVVGRVAAEVEEQGSTTISAHTLYDIIKKLQPGKPVSFVSEGDRIRIKSGRSLFRLPTMPVEGFPQYVLDKLPHSFSLSAEDLRNLIDKTKFAMGEGEARAYLCGIFLHVRVSGGTDVLRAVATNGKRLARFELPAPEGAVGMLDIILPRKTVGELRKLISDTSGMVEISTSVRNVCFTFDSTVLYSKLIDANYPEYERIIPTANDKTLKLACQEFTDALDRVSTISDLSRGVTLTIEDDRLNIRTSNKNAGEATEDVEVNYEGKELQIGFNSDYLMDAVRQIDDDNVEINIFDPLSAVILKNESNYDALYIIMPMKI